MTSVGLYEFAIGIATVVSAAGGFVAAYAAHRSAKSAHEAAASAAEESRRTSLRDLSFTAAQVVNECLSIQSIAGDLTVEYRAAEVFSGSSAHSALQGLIRATNQFASKAGEMLDDARKFTSGARSLAEAPREDIDRVAIRMGEHLLGAGLIRDELVRKLTEMNRLNADERSRRHARGP